MGVALRGNLEDFGIADVFQLIGQQRKTGVLEFTGETGHVQLRFDSGMVVSAASVGQRAEEALGEMLVRCGLLTRAQVDLLIPECDAAAQTVPRLAVDRGWISREELERIEDLLTRETFFEVLRWKRGAFDFRSVSVDHSRRTDSLLGAEQILMDGLRMIDEWHSFSEWVPSDDTIFRRGAGFEDYRHRTSLVGEPLEAAECVYQLVDGRISVRRIVDLSLLGTFDAVRLLADLRKTGVIEPLDSEQLRRVQDRGPARLALDRDEAVTWLGGLLCLALLAAVTLLSLRGPASEAPESSAAGIRIDRDVVGSLEAAYSLRRVRNAVEAQRFLDGGWPTRLERLEESGLLSRGSLASAGAHPYYYRKLDEGVVLLAPER